MIINYSARLQLHCLATDKTKDSLKSATAKADLIVSTTYDDTWRALHIVGEGVTTFPGPGYNQVTL